MVDRAMRMDVENKKEEPDNQLVFRTLVSLAGCRLQSQRATVNPWRRKQSLLGQQP